MHAILEDCSRHFLGNTQDDLASGLFLAEFVLINSICVSTRLSFFFEDFGDFPRVVPITSFSGVSKAYDFVERMQEVQSSLQYFLAQSK